MIELKNISSEEKTWGGMIFNPSEKKSIDPLHKFDIACDEVFYASVFNEDVEVYIDYVLIDDKILSCEAIRNEMRKDAEGSIITRIRQVADTQHRQHKTIEFITSTSGSLVDNSWVNTPSSECTLSFQKIVDDVLVTAEPSEATVTSLLWNHAWNTMPNYSEIRLSNIDSVIKAYIGSYGVEQYPQSRIAYGISFAMQNIYKFSVIEPRLLEYPLILRLTHTAGYQKSVEIFFEYFTDFVSP